MGVDDDFFRLGGDSILSIQATTRARRAGLPITTTDVFTNRTIARLAEIVGRRSDSDHALSDPGTAPLWPIAAAHIDRPGFEQFAQSYVFVTPAGVDRDAIERILLRVVDHHRVLRGHLDRDSNGTLGFTLPTEPARSVGDRLRDDIITGTWASGEWIRRIDDVVAEMSAQLDPYDGVLWRAAWYTDPEEIAGRLILVVHHLVIDGVSWRILEDDLAHAGAIETTSAGEAPLPVGTTITAWAHALSTRAAEPDVLAQADYWRTVVEADGAVLGSRRVDPVRDTTADTGDIPVAVPAAVTAAVLVSLPAALSARVDDVLLGTLAIAVAAWRARRSLDRRPLVIGLEGHGREDAFVPGADLSRTVGWFTTSYPVLLDTDEIDPSAALHDSTLAAEAILRVKHHLSRFRPAESGTGCCATSPLEPPTVSPLLRTSRSTTSVDSAPEVTPPPRGRAHPRRPASVAIPLTRCPSRRCWTSMSPRSLIRTERSWKGPSATRPESSPRPIPANWSSCGPPQ